MPDDWLSENCKIGADEAEAAFGVVTSHNRMPNGELRFRLIGSDGSGYIRTVASEKGGWQKSHSHPDFNEAYIVESGWMGIALRSEDAYTVSIQVLMPGQIFVTARGQVHNVYLAGNSVIHTVKFGVRDGRSEWKPEPDFDLQTRPITEQEILGSGAKGRSRQL